MIPPETGGKLSDFAQVLIFVRDPGVPLVGSHMAEDRPAISGDFHQPVLPRPLGEVLQSSLLTTADHFGLVLCIHNLSGDQVGKALEPDQLSSPLVYSRPVGELAPSLTSPSGVSAHVDLSKKRAWLYKDGQLSLASPICAGREGYETPEREFRVVAKHRDWASTIYKVPMPFFLRLNADSGKVDLHAGAIGLEHLSHGCIRLPKRMAELFFGEMPVGAKVVVTSGDTWIHSPYGPQS